MSFLVAVKANRSIIDTYTESDPMSEGVLHKGSISGPATVQSRPSWIPRTLHVGLRLQASTTKVQKLICSMHNELLPLVELM
jgi:hypothetical protein